MLDTQRASKCMSFQNVRNTPSTAGNSMTGSERPFPEPLLKKEADFLWKVPAALGCRPSDTPKLSPNKEEVSGQISFRIFWGWMSSGCLAGEGFLQVFVGQFRTGSVQTGS